MPLTFTNKFQKIKLRSQNEKCRKYSMSYQKKYAEILIKKLTHFLCEKKFYKFFTVTKNFFFQWIL